MSCDHKPGARISCLEPSLDDKTKECDLITLVLYTVNLMSSLTPTAFHTLSVQVQVPTSLIPLQAKAVSVA